MDKISKIINEWDPMNLMNHAPDDEYCFEISMIKESMKNIQNEQEFAKKIQEIFISQCGENYDFSIDKCTLVARKILKTNKKHNKLKKFLLILLILAIASFVIVESYIIYTGNTDYIKQDYDYVIILGAKVNGDDVCLALKYRLDKAVEYLNKNQNVKAVVSGGQGEDEEYPESYVMKNYLIKHGINENRIIEENKSTTTYENFYNSFSIIGESKILVVTNDFHMFRAILLAEKVGFEAEPLNAKTPDSIKYKMYLREFPAVFLSYIFNI